MTASNSDRWSRVKIRTNLQAQGAKGYSITVPKAVGDVLPPDQLYRMELTDEGLLFRPVEPDPQTTELPAWAKRD